MNEIIRRRMAAVKNGTTVKAALKKQTSSNKIIQQQLDRVAEMEAKGIIPPKKVRFEKLQEYREAKKPKEKVGKKESIWTKEYKKAYRKAYYHKQKEQIKANRLKREALYPLNYKTSEKFKREREAAILRGRRYYKAHRLEILAKKKLERQQKNEKKNNN